MSVPLEPPVCFLCVSYGDHHVTGSAVRGALVFLLTLPHSSCAQAGNLPETQTLVYIARPSLAVLSLGR